MNEVNNVNEEIELIMKAQKGDIDATSTIISKYFWLVRSIIRIQKYFINNGTADDLFQEGCLGIMKAIKTYDREKNPNITAYISLCIDSCIKDAVRSATREKHKILTNAVSTTVLEETGISLPSDLVYDPIHNYIEKEGLDIFYDKLSLLCTPIQLQTLKYYLDGYSYTEIASLMKIPEKKVDNLLSAVKKKIRLNKPMFLPKDDN